MAAVMVKGYVSGEERLNVLEEASSLKFVSLY